MDVGKITGNAAGAAAGRAELAVQPPEQEPRPESLPRNEAQCTVRISDEGYRRWELSQEELPQKQQGEIKLAEQQSEVPPPDGTLPQVEGAESVSELTEEERMDRITKLLQFLDSRTDYFAHAKPEPTKETDDEKVAALEEMRQLKEDQEALYRKTEAEAQALARKRAKSRNVVEKGMRELTIMLESVRPMERDKDKDQKKTDAADQENERQNDTVVRRSGEEDGWNAREMMHGFGRQIKRHAFHAELAMDRTVDRIYENMQRNFETVRTLDRELMNGLQEVYHVLEQDEVSEADKDAAVDRYLKDGVPILGELKIYMGMGLERVNNLRLLRLEQPGNQNMIFASRSQDAIHAFADENALDELSQDSFKQLEDENFEELAKRIRELQEEERTEETGAEESEEKETGEKEEAVKTVEDDRLS